MMNQRQLIIKAFSSFYAIQKVLMHIFRISNRIRQTMKLGKFYTSQTLFHFRHQRIVFNAFAFRIYPFKKRIATFTKFFVISHNTNTIGQNF